MLVTIDTKDVKVRVFIMQAYREMKKDSRLFLLAYVDDGLERAQQTLMSCHLAS